MITEVTEEKKVMIKIIWEDEMKEEEEMIEMGKEGDQQMREEDMVKMI